MKINDIIAEATLPRTAMAQFRAWGFRPAGSGSLKQVFVDDTGHALIVSPIDDETQSFIDWVKFCEQHKNHPHLPNFGGLRTVDIKGQQYLVTRAERLTPIRNPKLEHIIYAISFAASEGLGFDGAMKDLDGRIRPKPPGEQQAIRNLAQQVDLKGLFDILVEVEQARQKLGWIDDTNIDNFMLASNGRIVINDPWA